MSKLLSMFMVGLVGCATNGDDGVDPSPDATPPDEPFTNGVSTLSGSSDAGFVDGSRGVARFANPVNVAYGPDGRLYVADFDNGKIRVVEVVDGRTSTLIAQPNFQRPFGLAFAADGTLYVTTDVDDAGARDPMAGTVWRIDIAAQVATPIARRLGKPRGLAVLPDGRIAMSDHLHHVVRLLDPTTGVVAPLAGTWDVKGMVDGAGSKFSTPYGIAVRGAGLVVADFDNNRLRLIGLDGSVQTLAGSQAAGFVDGALATAKFDHPQGVAVTIEGDIYVTDLGNFRIRRIHDELVDTVAGVGRGGFLDNDDLLAAEFYGLEGMSVEPSGAMLFVADGGRGEAVPYNRVRSIKMD